MQLRISSQNLQHGGIQDSYGRDDDSRWSAITEAINATGPDILCLQEAHAWTDRNHAQLYRAQRDLGLYIAGWIPTGRSIGPTLVMYRPRPGRFELEQFESKDQSELYNGFSVPVFRVEDVPLAVISVHFPAESSPQAEIEAARAAARAYRFGGNGIVMGDLNCLPLQDPAPDPATLRALNAAALHTHNHNGQIVPDRRVARHLTLARLTDAAAHLAAASGDTSLLAGTGTMGVRRDQAWLTPSLVPALTGYERRRHKGSDHCLITIDLDTVQISRSANVPAS